MSDPARVFVLYGNDEYAIAKRLADFESAFSDPTSADMNTSRLEGRSLRDDELNTAVNAMPFLASQRLVILREPSAKYSAPSARKKFGEFLAAVPPTTRLVLVEAVENNKREEENHWLLKWAAKTGEGVKTERFMMPKARELPGWIIAETKKQGGEIEPAAAARLAEMVGENTRQAAQEITKLLTYVKFERKVSLADVELVSVTTAQGDIFALVDALGQGQGRQAQSMLHRLLDEQDAFSLFGMVVRQFRLLLLARELLDGSSTQLEIQQKLGLHPFVAEKVTKQARGFSMPTLENIYRRLLRMDEQAKNGEVPLDVALDVFVVELVK